MTKARKPKQRSAKPPKASPENDAALWQAFVENIERADLKGRVSEHESVQPGNRFDAKAVKASSTKPSSRKGQSARALTPLQSPSAAPPKPAKPQPSNIDAKQSRRIGKGRTTIDARIDLHGLRQSEAHSALRVFLLRSAAKGHRIVLVITGKGSTALTSGSDTRFGAFVHEGAPERGVLRRSVPMWLSEPDLRSIVVGYTSAHIRHGGEGALYVQLRRKRA